jgi:hypothetical protein
VVRTLAIARKSAFAFRHAEHRRHDGDRQHCEEGLSIKRIGVGAHAGSGGIGKFGEGERAMGRNECVPSNDILAARPGQSHGVPIVLDDAIVTAQQEKPGRRRSVRLRDHAAEKLPLGIVAAAAETPNAGQSIAPIRGDGASDRRIGAGGKRGGVLPHLVLRRLRETGKEPLMRGEQRIDPSGRAAPARNRRDDLSEHLEPMLESAVSAGLHDTE